MDSSSKVPLSHSLWSPHDTVKDAAESLGINLPEEAAKNLAMDVEYRIHEILETAIKFMRHSKRKLLMTTDVNNALKVLNIEPLYGYDNSQPLVFKEALVGAGGQTLYYIDDNEIEFEKLINQELPKVPRQTTFTAHWLAIEGVQPMVPQNPLPAEIKSLPPIIRGATSSMLGNDILNLGQSGDNKDSAQGSSVATKDKKPTEKESEVKPLVKHVLSKELKLYFDKVVEVLISTDPEKENLKDAALTSLKNDPGLHQLVPYFIQFVAEQITNQLRNIEILSTMLEVISALVDNKTIFLDPYVHALMPCILTLLLAKRIGPIIKDTTSKESQDILRSQLAVREFAAILLEHIIKVYGSSYSTLRPRVTRTLLRALLDSSKPVGTHYGALLGLKNMGSEVVKLVLVGNLKVWCSSVVENSDKSDYEKDILLSTTLDILRKLKITVPQDENQMEVDGEGFSEEIKTKLNDSIGDTLAEIVLDQDDAKDIVRGLFFGELVV
ncbi:TATA-binding protein-associated factor [Scheffersomyces xylosifermentans]|uniref:TATA-binding protein-associated factor n=1 Tax=Scheffersomyces xylosifermentans TaxID=1304137 RepID=UPI00315C8750